MHSIILLVRPVPQIADPAELLAFVSYRSQRPATPEAEINDALTREKRHAEALLHRWQRAVGPFSRLPRQILHYQGNPKPMTPSEARATTDQAIRQLVNSKPGTRVIWMIDGDGCGQLWPSLYDNRLGSESDAPFPGGARDRDIAVLRLHTDQAKLPRPAAKGDWSEGGIGKVAGMGGSLLRLTNDQEATPWYFVNTPRIMDNVGSHKYGTRFRQQPQQLKDPWHALSPTELLCLHAGPFRPADIYELAARLCRRATHWGGVLRQPVPVHLAETLVIDCPDSRAQAGDED